MRYVLAIAVLAAIAALTLSGLAVRVAPGRANALGDGDDRSGVGGALSFRAQVVAPGPGHTRALQAAYARAHGGTPPQPRRLREANHRGVVWALATFVLADGTIVSERFSRRGGQTWQDLGPTPARCPVVPREVRSAWRLTACQTS